MIVSPDTRREHRMPPGQSRTQKWPVLDASGPPRNRARTVAIRIDGKVARPVEWTWAEFQKLPRVKVFSDFHCVTRWSRLGNIWEGVSTRELVERAGGAMPDARYVLAHGYDGGWTTNLPLEDFLAEDALVALLHDGDPITSSTAARRGSSFRGSTPGRAPSGCRSRAARPRSSRLLGAQRLPHARRSMEGRALRSVITVGLSLIPSQ